LLTGNAANTDPVCEFSPNRVMVDAVLADINSANEHPCGWTYRINPSPIPRIGRNAEARRSG
jgi:hypothetical protein